MVPKLLPWKEPVKARNNGRRVCHRAAFMAASFASDPLLEKKTFLGYEPGVIELSCSPNSINRS